MRILRVRGTAPCVLCGLAPHGMWRRRVGGSRIEGTKVDGDILELIKTLVFINYRSCDEPFAALFLDKRLTERFGRGQVFRDSRTIRLGTHFPAEILRALHQCRAMIVVIGERWFRGGPDGKRFIDRPGDYVRMEIAEALRRDILVVPVLVGEVSLPYASALPPDIAGLATRQYLQMRPRSADHDASRLVDELVELLGEAGLRASRPGRVRQRRSEPAPRQPAPAAPRQPAPVTFNDFRGPVDARYAVFGNVSHAG
jgi:TIR domain-containing protein